MKHIMIDIVPFARTVKSPLCAIEAVCFDPQAGQANASAYWNINVGASIRSLPPQGVHRWISAPAEIRQEMDCAHYIEQRAVSELINFISDNADDPSNLSLWFRDLQFKKSVLDYTLQFHRMESISSDYRCLDSLIELAADAGYYPHPRNDLQPFTLTDARYQAEQVCDIWRRLSATPETVRGPL